jgi:hypothetical protein
MSPEKNQEEAPQEKAPQEEFPQKIGCTIEGCQRKRATHRNYCNFHRYRNNRK